MRKYLKVLAAGGLLFLAGCTVSQAKSPAQLPGMIPAGAASLEGTSWRLVEFQSMDDAQGIARPADPEMYTMEFMADGRVALRLDCNRGIGTWSSIPADDGVSGSISFSQLAVTRALCPEPSLGERLERDTQYMRGYLLRDGKLNISLMADGGIYVWEPQPASQ